MFRVILPVTALAAELLTLGCAARHVGIPGCSSAVQAVMPAKCGSNSYLRVVKDRVEVVCVINGKERVQYVSCFNELPPEGKAQ